MTFDSVRGLVLDLDSGTFRVKDEHRPALVRVLRSLFGSENVHLCPHNYRNLEQRGRVERGAAEEGDMTEATWSGLAPFDPACKLAYWFRG